MIKEAFCGEAEILCFCTSAFLIPASLCWVLIGRCFFLEFQVSRVSFFLPNRFITCDCSLKELLSCRLEYLFSHTFIFFLCYLHDHKFHVNYCNVSALHIMFAACHSLLIHCCLFKILTKIISSVTVKTFLFWDKWFELSWFPAQSGEDGVKTLAVPALIPILWRTS